MTDTSPAAVERPCPNCGVTLDGHSGIRSYGTYSTHDTAYCLRYLRDQRDAANARADRAEAQLAGARDAALVEAAAVAIARKGNGEATLDHPYDKGYLAACDSCAAAILALRDKPAETAPQPDLCSTSELQTARAVTVQDHAKALLIYLSETQDSVVWETTEDAMAVPMADPGDVIFAALRAIAGGGDE